MERKIIKNRSLSNNSGNSHPLLRDNSKRTKTSKWLNYIHSRFVSIKSKILHGLLLSQPVSQKNNKKKRKQNRLFQEYKYYEVADGITYGIDTIKLRISNPTIIDAELWVKTPSGHGYYFQHQKAPSGFKTTHPKIRSNGKCKYLSATLTIPYISSLSSTDMSFDKKCIKNIINQYLNGIGIKRVKSNRVRILEVDLFVDYIIPESSSYLEVFNQHRASINPAINRKYRETLVHDTFSLVSNTAPGQIKYKKIFTLYNKSEQLLKKHRIQTDRSVARMELRINTYQLQSLSQENELYLNQWLDKNDWLSHFHKKYNELFLFKGVQFGDMIHALKQINGSSEFKTFCQVYVMDALVNEGCSHAAVLDLLEDQVKLSESSVLRLRRSYGKYSDLLHYSFSKSQLRAIRGAIIDMIEKNKNKG